MNRSSRLPPFHLGVPPVSDERDPQESGPEHPSEPEGQQPLDEEPRNEAAPPTPVEPEEHTDFDLPPHRTIEPAGPIEPAGYPPRPKDSVGYPPRPTDPVGYPPQPTDPVGYPPQPTDPVGYPPQPPPPAIARSPRIRTNVVLFVLTLACTFYWGFIQYQQFYAEELRGLFTTNPLRAPEAALGGAPFGLAIITFLLAHEMGHYLACRHYKIAASLPYFIPFPPPLMFVFLLMPGTMGAVIRIRGAITSRRALFDIAVAGPIAGWLTALPILAYGLSQSRVVEKVEIETSVDQLYFTLGEPLIWGPMSRLFAPEVGPSQELVMHPLAFVGWFALLITAFNLLPVGQLDGGHLLYAGARHLHRLGTYVVLGLLLVAGWYYFPGWIVFAAMISLLSLAAGGFRHPAPRQFEPSLGGGRILLMLLAIAIFATSFMLVPVELPRVLSQGFR